MLAGCVTGALIILPCGCLTQYLIPRISLDVSRTTETDERDVAEYTQKQLKGTRNSYMATAAIEAALFSDSTVTLRRQLN